MEDNTSWKGKTLADTCCVLQTSSGWPLGGGWSASGPGEVLPPSRAWACTAEIGGGRDPVVNIESTLLCCNVLNVPHYKIPNGTGYLILCQYMYTPDP